MPVPKTIKDSIYINLAAGIRSLFPFPFCACFFRFLVVSACKHQA
ncbi:hypothetical protein CSUI_001594 [Cystoisospora suis]|uniref:Uncharacterized protein n=1 Tax=Cystoisospora suis TaxID=483139 RepID=A0A2C6KWX8_9APIC|nr:hypothetical protein CSUI_001594 [Cystoisospora suis]